MTLGIALVTGASGVLGRRVADGLFAAGWAVRRASRSSTVKIDLSTGEGLDAALDGVGVVVHCASSPFSDPNGVDVRGTGRLLEAARRGGSPHVVYPSIVGIERLPSTYYDAKLATERVIEAGGLPFTILRATQFHTLIDDALAAMHRWPLIPVPWPAPLQPVHPTEVAERLVTIAQGAPLGRAVDFGGPEVLEFGALVDLWQERRRRRWRIPIPVPPFPAAAAGLRRGGLCCPEGDRGVGTFAAWLDASP